jgi:LacI family transcriptional regulator
MAEPPRVAVLIETSREYGRGLLRGVARYISEHGPWSVYFQPQGLESFPPPGLANWRGDGILSRVNSLKAARAVLDAGLPTVELRGAFVDLGLPMVGVNNREVAKMGGAYLLERGLQHFAFCGAPRRENRFLDQRCDFFKRFVEEAGYRCSVFPAKRLRGSISAWEAEQNRIADWLNALPRPCGLMTCHDERGRQVLDAAHRCNLTVPDELAVVSVDNDEHLCSLSNPPLTSIDVNPVRIGYEATKLLDRWMNGKRPSCELVEIEPRGLVVRQSSDMIAVSDAIVSAAFQFVREHACEGISVDQVLRHLDISRSTLEKRFKKALGRTPKSLILHEQLERAKQLLRDTRVPLSVVAERSGLGSVSYFVDVFGRKVGMTPGTYREHHLTRYEADGPS